MYVIILLDKDKAWCTFLQLNNIKKKQEGKVYITSCIKKIYMELFLSNLDDTKAISK